MNDDKPEPDEHLPDLSADGKSSQASGREVAKAGLTQVGPYRIVQKIAEGGMGAVYMAQQSEPIKRRVALKLIKAGRDTEQIIARFDAERQALAMMDHANIARIFDAGTTNDGSPYFVMELVNGIPLTDYCDNNRLSIRERLKLFVPVCKAVQHAHTKGIIHRDLKPSNVLVALYDGVPVPKVIDFGLAKATEHQLALTDKTMFTEFGQVVGTLQYMSPEQAEMNQLDVDTRTDVYSLGVMLYELLTGSTPLDKDTMKAHAVIKVLELIREKEPPRPSTRLSDSMEVIDGVAAQRGIDQSRLRKILRGELDWIVMKSLEKNRTRRYETANAFAEDISRFLQSEPVTARPPSASYRVLKFASRHRGLVASLATIMLLLAAGVAAVSVSLYRVQQSLDREQEANEQTQQALLIADRKRNEAEQATTLASNREQQALDSMRVVVEGFKRVNPRFGGNASASVKDVLKHMETQLDAGEVAPIVRANLLGWLAVTWQGLGNNDAAIVAGETSSSLYQELQGARSVNRLRVMNVLGVSYLGKGNRKRAEEILRETYEVQCEVLEETHPDAMLTLGNLANCLKRTGRQDEASKLLEKLVRLNREALGETAPKTLQQMVNLAAAWDSAGRRKEAIELYEKTIVLMGKSPGIDAFSVVVAKIGLAMSYQKDGRLEEAIALHAENIEASTKHLGRDHPTTIRALSSYGNGLRVKGSRKAQKVLEEAFRLSVDRNGASHEDTSRIANNLGLQYLQDRQHLDAIRMLATSFKSKRKRFGLFSRRTMTSQTNLTLAVAAARKEATMCLAGGRGEKAEKLLGGIDREVRPLGALPGDVPRLFALSLMLQEKWLPAGEFMQQEKSAKLKSLQAICSLRMGDWDQAGELCSAAGEKKPTGLAAAIFASVEAVCAAQENADAAHTAEARQAFESAKETRVAAHETFLLALLAEQVAMAADFGGQTDQANKWREKAHDFRADRQ